MKKNILYHALACLTLFATSCDVSYLDKDIDDITWDGSVRIPAGTLTYTVSELFQELGSDEFDSASTEELSFSYTESFSNATGSNTTFDVPSKTISSSVSTPVTAADLASIGETFPYTITEQIATPGGPMDNPLIGTQSDSDQVVYDLALDQDITGASFDGGTMSIDFESTFDAEVTLTIEIPSFTKKSDDAIYSKTVVFSGAGTETVVITLNEYNANFTHNGTDFEEGIVNKVVMNLDAEFEFSAGNTLNEADKISYEAVLADIGTEVIYGDFKQEEFSLSSQSISLSFFDNFGEGDVSFTSPKMKLTATSKYGFPLGIDLSEIVATGNGNTTNLEYDGDSGIANMLIIDEVANFGDADKVTNRTLNTTNSNIRDLLEAKPTEIALNISGIANPINGSPNTNFYAKSTVATDKDINVNLTISFDDVTFNKDIDFDNGDDLDDFTDIKLSIGVENKIPLKGSIVLDFKNSSNQITHTESITAFNAANVNQTGSSDGVAVVSNFDIELSSSEIDAIKDSETIEVRLTLDLPSGEDSVTLHGSDELKLFIGAVVDAEITSDDN
ncbi:hypothetical protein [Flavicella sediminum]|uniref:hypothetical protein n=1 Tax=Flavicella sediminum TaxID=2585141 RepID=UPI0011239940|nr:hypothetical protein [Flavicella sediminum]